MQGIMGAFLDGMQDGAPLVAHPINSFTHRIGRRQFMILNVVFGFVFLFLVDHLFQILGFLLLLFFFFVFLFIFSKTPGFPSCFFFFSSCRSSASSSHDQPISRAMIRSLSGWSAYFSSNRPYFSVSASLSRRNCSYRTSSHSCVSPSWMIAIANGVSSSAMRRSRSAISSFV